MTINGMGSAHSGQWHAVHIPASHFILRSAVDYNPSSPAVWTNVFGANMIGSGWTFYHPTSSSGRRQQVDYDLLLPANIKRHRDGAGFDYMFSLSWWSSGDMGVNQVIADIDVAPYGDGTALNSVAPVRWNAICSNNPGMLLKVVPAKNTFSGALFIAEESHLHIRVGRAYQDFTGLNTDTYLYEWFLYSVTFHYRVY